MNMSGMSQKFFQLKDVDLTHGYTLLPAVSLENRHVPPCSPEMVVIIPDIESIQRLGDVSKVLESVYPRTHTVKVVQESKSDDLMVTDSTLSGLVSEKDINFPATLILPPLAQGSSFEQFQEIIAHLRAPDGCPWDREQTHLTLRKHLIEESYELLDAIDSGDPSKMEEEFGDLLLQIVLNAQIAWEASEFTMNEVIKGIHDKIVRRHPHVFGDVQVTGVDHVLQNWEKIKAAERKESGSRDKSLLDGLPGALPAMVQAQEYQTRAARVGFDWPEIGGVLDKIQEEIEEVKHTTEKKELTAELGDLFFALVNLARWKDVDAESALRETNHKFRTRFGYIERKASDSGKQMDEMSLDEMEAYWQEAKHQSH